MELLELLEQRVEAMLSEIDGLRAENRRLQEQVATLQHSVEEAEEAQLQLEQDHEDMKAEALSRVDRLLKRIEGSLAREDASAQN